jgi:pyrroloquinoline quinone (PQQ) biosynthesis protein C
MSFQNNSEAIRYRIDLMNGPRAAASEALWSHPRLNELFVWALVRTYMMTSATVPLMTAALRRAEELGASDQVARGFAEYLQHHIPEEAGHDEQFLDDLEVLGMSREAVNALIPWPSLAALLGMQYYWILHRHPIAFAGYSAILEGNPVSVDEITAFQERSGLPSDAFRTLIWHSKHDPEHTAELDAVLDDLPLTDDHMGLIGVNIAHTHNLLARSVHEMIAAFDQRFPLDERASRLA